MSLDEFVSDIVAKTKRVEDVLPIASPENERFAVFLLPVVEIGFHAPPRVEVHVFDPANVVDHIDVNSAAQRLALNVADEMPLVVRGVDAVI